MVGRLLVCVLLALVCVALGYGLAVSNTDANAEVTRVDAEVDHVGGQKVDEKEAFRPIQFPLDGEEVRAQYGRIIRGAMPVDEAGQFLDIACLKEHWNSWLLHDQIRHDPVAVTGYYERVITASQTADARLMAVALALATLTSQHTLTGYDLTNLGQQIRRSYQAAAEPIRKLCRNRLADLSGTIHEQATRAMRAYLFEVDPVGSAVLVTDDQKAVGQTIKRILASKDDAERQRLLGALSPSSVTFVQWQELWAHAKREFKATDVVAVINLALPHLSEKYVRRELVDGLIHRFDVVAGMCQYTLISLEPREEDIVRLKVVRGLAQLSERKKLISDLMQAWSDHEAEF